MARRKTFQTILAESRDDWRFNSASIQGCSISCGVNLFSGLREGFDAKDQARALSRALTNKAIVLISDNGSKRFFAAKAIGTASDSVTNPNSGNKIRVWAITKAMIPKIYYYAEDQAKLKAKKKSSRSRKAKA